MLKRISTGAMINLQIAKWGNSLAVRIPADYVRQIGVKEGAQLQVHLSADGALNLRPSRWNRKLFAQELASNTLTLTMGTPVMEELRQEARY
jgi:antitoxin MazE